MNNVSPSLRHPTLSSARLGVDWFGRVLLLPSANSDRQRRRDSYVCLLLRGGGCEEDVDRDPSCCDKMRRGSDCSGLVAVQYASMRGVDAYGLVQGWGYAQRRACVAWRALVVCVWCGLAPREWCCMGGGCWRDRGGVIAADM